MSLGSNEPRYVERLVSAMSRFRQAGWPDTGQRPRILRSFRGRLQLPVALRVDLLLTTSKHVLRRDIANGTVQAEMACFSQSSSQKSRGTQPLLVHLPVAFPPVVELAAGDVEPPDEASGTDLGLVGPAPDKVYDLVPCIV